MNRELQAIQLKVIILPDGKQTETKSGIYTGVYSVDGPLRYGTVVSVGNRVTDIVPNDRVCWLVQDENGFQFNDVRHVWMYGTQVAGKIE